MAKVVVILGSRGALGKSVADAFGIAKWSRVLCDLGNSDAHGSVYVNLAGGADAKSRFDLIRLAVSTTTSGSMKVDAIVNVSGGFRMDSAENGEIFDNLSAMYQSSVESSVVAAHLAAQCLATEGLLVLPGAAAAVGPTPWALTYGSMKAAVHHLVKSLSKKNGGLPANARVIGLAPVMLDTPANRSSMPDADTSTWSSTDEVAGKILGWAENKDALVSGSVYKILTSNGVTTYVPI